MSVTEPNKLDAAILLAKNLIFVTKDKWSRAYIDDLPDSAFLYVESGGTKDSEGKTTPKSLRHFPVRDKDGKLDLPHLRNALSRIPQSKLPQAVKDKLKEKAQRLLAQSTEKAAADNIDKARNMTKPKKPGSYYKRIETIDVKKIYVTKVNIAKSTDTQPVDEQFVLGIVLEPDVIDAQNDTYDEQTIRKTAHKFMEDYQDIGLMHEGSVDNRAKIVESYLAPVDFDIEGQPVKKGTWILAAHIVDDGLWQDIKKGNLTGWSIGGTAISTPIDN